MLSKYEAVKISEKQIVHFAQSKLTRLCDSISVEGFLVLQRRNTECFSEYINEAGTTGKACDAADIGDRKTTQQQIFAIGQSPGFQIAFWRHLQVFPEPAGQRGGADIETLGNVCNGVQI